jgi:zinc protease
VYEEGTGLVLSGVVSRGAATAAAGELLRLSLADRFREEAGTAYAPWSVYERVDADRALLISGSDVQPAGHETLVRDAIDVVHHLAEHGPDPARLADCTTSFVQGLRDPYATFGVATRAGLSLLHGKPRQTIEEMVDEIQGVTVADAQATFVELRGTLLLGVPGGVPVENRLPELRFERVDAYRDGHPFRHRDWPAVTDRLVVHDSKLELRTASGSLIAPYRELAGVVAFDDGGRHLVRSDGYGITVEPEVWHNGAKAVADVDRLVDSSLQLPHPARQGSSFDRLGAWTRWRRALSRGAVRGMLSTPVLVLIVLALWVAGFVAIVWLEVPYLGLVWAILGGRFIWGLVNGDDDT